MPEPRVGDSVFATGYANGKITYIDWSDKEVTVYFYNSDSEEPFEWDSFDCFNERLNQWQIHI